MPADAPSIPVAAAVYPQQVSPPFIPAYATHISGAWCGYCGLVLYVYAHRCPNCRHPVGVVPVRSRWPFDVAFRFVLARRLQIAASFLLGIGGGFALGSIGTILAYAWPRDIAVEAALGGWVAGLIAYRRTRFVDLALSRGLGIGTLLGQLVFIAALAIRAVD